MSGLADGKTHVKKKDDGKIVDGGKGVIQLITGSRVGGARGGPTSPS